MAKKAEVEKHIKKIVERLNDVGPVLLDNWGGAVLFSITDLKTGWKLKMAMDGSVESCLESTDESGAGVLEMDSDTFVGIYSKKIGVPEARDSGKMKVRGGLDALVRLMPHTVG